MIVYRKDSIFLLRILILFSLFLGCKQNDKSLKTTTVYLISYSYKGDTIDSIQQPVEKYFYNSRTELTSYIDYKNKYRFEKKKGKENLLYEEFYYSLGNKFLYKNIYHLNKNGKITEVFSYDTFGKIMNHIQYTYNNKDSLLSQITTLPDGSKFVNSNEYDKYGNITKKTIQTKTEITSEIHKIKYSNNGKILSDTINYKVGRKILSRNYINNILFYEIQKFEKLNEEGKYISFGKDIPIRKIYYMYDKNGLLYEKRFIKLFEKNPSLIMEGKEEFIHNKLGKLIKYSIYNSKNKKTYSYVYNYE